MVTNEFQKIYRPCDYNAGIQHLKKKKKKVGIRRLIIPKSEHHLFNQQNKKYSLGFPIMLLSLNKGISH